MNVDAEDLGAAASSASTAHRPREANPAEPQPVHTPEHLDVEGANGVYFLVDPKTHNIRGTLLDDGGGWWRARTPSGRVRKLFVPAGVENPCLYVARKVGGS